LLSLPWKRRRPISGIHRLTAMLFYDFQTKIVSGSLVQEDLLTLPGLMIEYFLNSDPEDKELLQSEEGDQLEPDQ